MRRDGVGRPDVESETVRLRAAGRTRAGQPDAGGPGADPPRSARPVRSGDPAAGRGTGRSGDGAPAGGRPGTGRPPDGGSAAGRPAPGRSDGGPAGGRAVGGRDAGRAAPGGPDDRRSRPGATDPGRALPERVAGTAGGRAARRAQERHDQRRGRRWRRRSIAVLAAVVLVGVIAGGGWYVYRSFFTTPDYPGPGDGDVVVQVRDGDTTRAIGEELTARGVTASADAFTVAAAGSERIRSVQPGYYRLRLHMSGAGAVALLLDPTSRLGVVDIRGGVQLDDTRSPDGAVTPGVLSQIAKATCGATPTCASADDLRAVMAGTDPAALGVPSWAQAAVAKAPPTRRFEGLLVPGRYDVQPGASAGDLWRALLTESARRFDAAGLVTGAEKAGKKPYDVLVIASLVEKESIISDMPKVARVIDNRLEAGQRLELDTTINYPLDVPSLYTSPENRAKPGPYNTYLNQGLPVTPIADAGSQALAAALNPAPGPWMFFVPCQKDGTSCFAVTFAEHQANVAKAHANGVF